MAIMLNIWWNVGRHNKRKERGQSKRVGEWNVIMIILPHKWPCPARIGRKSIHKVCVCRCAVFEHMHLFHKSLHALNTMCYMYFKCELAYIHTLACALCNYVGEDKVKLWRILAMKPWLEASQRVKMPTDYWDPEPNRIPMSPSVS